MIIQSLKLNNFGRFHKKGIQLSEGINIIYGDNEAGKTTIHSFIRAMFFGAARLRGRAAVNDIYSQYEPWENPGFYEGSMEFSTKEHHYRIDRVFQKNVKNVVLTDIDTGSVVLLGDRGIESVMEGFSEDSFYNTISVSQTETGIDGIIANLNMSKSGDINVKEALETLNENRRNLDKKKQGLGIEELENRLKEYDNLDEKISVISEKISSENSNKNSSENSSQNTSENERINRPAKIIPQKQKVSNNGSSNNGFLLQKLGVILPIAALIFGYCFMKLHSISYLSATVICVLTDAFLIYVSIKKSINKSKLKSNLGDSDDSHGSHESDESHDSDESILESMKQIERLNWELDNAFTLSNRRDQLMEELEECNKKSQELDDKIRSITLAISTIQSFSKDIEACFGDSLNELASEYISRFTRGKYDNLRVNSNMKVTICEDGKVVNMNNVSFATQEQVHLSVRLAASKLLFPNEAMPIILDETFAHYDDIRLEDTLLSLARMGNQVIVFTCNRREISVLERVGVGFALITI